MRLTSGLVFSTTSTSAEVPGKKFAANS